METTARLTGRNQAQVINTAVLAWALIRQHQATGGQVYFQMPDGKLHPVILTEDNEGDGGPP